MSRPAIRICKRLVAPGAASRARCPPCRAERVPSAGAGAGCNLGPEASHLRVSVQSVSVRSFVKTLANESNVLPASTVPRVRCKQRRGCVSALGPPTVLYYFYPTIIRDACPLCSLSDSARSACARSQGRRRRPGPCRHPNAASRAAMAVDDHLGAPTVGGGCSRVAADLACRPDSEQITLPQGRSSASSLPAKPTHPPTPTPTGSRLAGTGPSPQGGVGIARSHVHGAADCGATAKGGVRVRGCS